MKETFSQPSSASSAHLSLALKPNRSRKVKLEKIGKTGYHTYLRNITTKLMKDHAINWTNMT